MKKLIHFDPAEAGRLHCDACGHDLPEKQAFTAELIGTPCPKCGADMLTLKDFLATKRLFRRVAWINRWFGWLGTEKVPAGIKAKQIQVRIHNDELIVRKGQPS